MKVFLLLFLFASSFAEKIESLEKGKITYLSLYDLGSSQGWNLQWEVLLNQVQWKDSLGHDFQVKNGLASLSVDQNFLDLEAPVLYELDQIWVPQKRLLAILDSIQGFESVFNGGKLIRSPKKDLIEVIYDPRKNGTLVTLKMTKPLPFESFFPRPHFILRFPKLDVGSVNFDTTFTRGQIRNLKTFAEETSYQLTWEVNHLVGDIEVLPRGEGENDLRVLFRRPVEETPTTQQVPDALKKTLKTIIIDPGHGGKDVGALGKKHQEKDIVLKVAKELKKLLLKKGYKVKLTRDDDEFIPLRDRPKKASEWEGDLFISLHCNAIDGKPKRKNEVSGFKIYILREAKSEEDKTLARRENKFIEDTTEGHGKGELSPVEWITLEHQLNLYTKESEAYTNHLVESFNQDDKKVRRHGTGASQAGFYVLVGAYMPAVLVELGFISNPQDEKYMASRSGQKNMAKRLAESIDAYKKELESR